MLLVRGHHLELHVTPAGHGAPGTLDNQGNVPVAVSDLKSDINDIIKLENWKIPESVFTWV